jgi:uncharacterized protein YkwD
MKAIVFFALLVFCIIETRADDLVDSISRGINSIRLKANLSVLSRDIRLDCAAKSQSDWMASVGRMEHLREHPRSLDEYKSCEHHPSNRVVKSGYFAFDDLFVVAYNNGGVEIHPRPIANTHVGEIIAAGRGGDFEIRRPDLILEGWMKSPGHKQNILTPHFRDFGVGVASRPGEIYFCVVFASKEL